ncbi:MAG TPA: hypothetical protein VF142_20375 [Longimicrobium sp.]
MSETTPETVAPLNYMQLRQLAECTVGLSDGVTDFVFNGHGLEPLLQGAAPPDGVVLVSTTNTTKRTALAYLTLCVGPASLDIAGLGADAVFWTDAAVEKFVFPYCASCGACEATKAVTDLHAAWNRYPEGTQVVALLHVAGAVPGTSVADSFYVAYLEGGALKTSPVSVFTADHRPPRTIIPEPPGPVPYQRGIVTTTTPHYPNYTHLRAMAEWANSIRDTPLYFTYNVRTGSYGPPTATLPPVLEDTIVIPVCTPSNPEDRQQPTGVWFQPGTSTGSIAPMDLSGIADAVFWSTGAIEQFLLPYYASVNGFAGLARLQEISDAWLNNVIEPLHAGHVTEMDAPEADGESDAPEVFGLVHLPRSVWMEVDSESTLVESQVGMVHRPAGAPAPTVLPARHFRERYGRRSR